MSRRRPAAFGIVGTLTLAWAIAGCSTPEPTIMETPTIVWAEDIEPSSPLENEPMVKAAREAWIGKSLAWNTGNFTIAQLTDYVTDEEAATLARLYGRQGHHTDRDPGPWPWQPLRVVEDTSEYGLFEVCRLEFDSDQLKSSAAAGYRPWSITPQDPVGGGYDRAATSVYQVRMEKVGNEYVMNEGFEPHSTGETCDGSTIPVGLFDPQPDPPPDVITEPARAPLIDNWEEVARH